MTRPKGAVVRVLTPKDVSEVMRRWGYYYQPDGYDTKAITDALNDRLLTRTEEPAHVPK